MMSTNSIVDAVPFKVVIVGAGLSGLATARRILSKTENTLEKLPSILIVEARNRVGGRTETYEILDAKIDVGAQWIGSSHTKLLDLINTFGFCLLEQFYPSSPMMEEIKAESRLIECVNYKIAPLSDTDNKSLQTYINLVEDLSSKIDLLNLSSCFEEYRLFDTMSVEQHIRDNIDASSEVYIKSGGGMVALGDGEEGAQKYKVAGGMQQVSDAMLRDLQEKGVEIMFNTPVQLVSVEGIYVRLFNRKDELIAVTEKVVFAIAPQLVATIQFTPQLSEEKRVLYNSMVAGHAVKVVVLYHEAFWLCGQSNEDNNINGNNNDNKDSSSTGASTHFHEIGFVHNLFHTSVPVHNQHTTATTTAATTTAAEEELPGLVGLITGKAAVEFASLSPESRKDSVLHQLWLMYGRSPQALHPFHYAEKIWSEEEFSGGCFVGVFPPTGVLSAHGEHHLRKPVGNSLYWASTETAEQFMGYMEGALRAGYRAADEVIASWI